MDDFFKTQQGKDLYIDRVAFLASKYANNPTIMGWELWNEINSVSFSRRNSRGAGMDKRNAAYR